MRLCSMIPTHPDFLSDFSLHVNTDLHCAGLVVSHLWTPEVPLAFWKTQQETDRVRFTC